MKRTATLLLLLLSCAAVARYVTFEGHRVVEVELRTQEELEWLAALPEETDGVRGVDVWTRDGVLALGKNTVRLTPSGFAALAASTLSYTVKIADLQASIDAKNAADSNSKTSKRSGVGAYDPEDEWFYSWHSFDEIEQKLSEVAGNYSSFVTLVPGIAKSHEGRVINGVKFSGRNNPQKRVVILAGTHAREWIAEGVSLWAIATLAELYGKNETITNIVDNLEIYVVPVYNPDGYEYSRTTNRYWRKNRRNNGDGSYGVDPNRNWDVDWCRTGSSKSTSSDIYCGPAPFSEPEVKGVFDWLGTLGPIASIIDLHSNAQEILRPYGYSQNKCPDEDAMAALGAKMVASIKAVHGRTYQSIRAVQLYVHSGTAVDGNYALRNIKKSFVIELAGDDFVVPVSDIKVQGEEIFAGFMAFFQDALSS